MAIFGSFFRGAQNGQSDVDIAVEFDRSKRKSLLDFVCVKDELSRVFQRKVDLAFLAA
jgi:predicted nucleotidyltransferase